MSLWFSWELGCVLSLESKHAHAESILVHDVILDLVSDPVFSRIMGCASEGVVISGQVLFVFDGCTTGTCM